MTPESLFLSPRERTALLEICGEIAAAVTGGHEADLDTLTRQAIERWPSGWSADSLLLATFARLAGAEHGAILEVGSGLSTLVLAAITDRTGTPSHVLEHDPWWFKRITSLTAESANVWVHQCPIIGYESYDWYEVPGDLPERFGLVLCDGPPGTTRGGRAGLAELADQIRGATVLLDDTHRPKEQAVLKHWQYELGATWTSRRPGAIRTYARKLREAHRRDSFAVVEFPEEF